MRMGLGVLFLRLLFMLMVLGYFCFVCDRIVDSLFPGSFWLM